MKRIELKLKDDATWEDGMSLLTCFGYGAILKVVESRLSPLPKKMSKLVVVVEILKPSDSN